MEDNKKPRIEVGYRFNKLLVISPTSQRKNGYIIWNCKCDCGEIIQLDTRCLQRRTVKDCGCETKVRPGQKDLTGKRFGRLIALRPVEINMKGPVIWCCRCDCGNEISVSSKQLLSGSRKSYNCLSKPGLKDWVGKRFGQLEVLEYAGKKNGSHFWKCRCDCGNETTVCQSNLKSGHTLSCGCIVDINNNFHFVEGTLIEAIQSERIFKSNTSGVRGVYQNKKNGKWIAQIKFKGKTYCLGSYSKIEDAAKVRKQAEEKLFGEFLNWYYNDFVKDQG